MKKFFLVLIASLAVFSFIACDNIVGGEDSSPQNYFTAVPTDNGIAIKVHSKLITPSSTYRIIRTDGTDNRLEICGNNTSGKDLQIVDYFVDSGKTYTYELLNNGVSSRNNQNRKITVKATKGKGDIKIKTEPIITCNENIVTVNTNPEFNDITGLEPNFTASQFLNFKLKTKYASDISSINMEIPSNGNSINLLKHKPLWGETVNSIDIVRKYEINGVGFKKYFPKKIITNPITIGMPTDSVILSVLDYEDLTHPIAKYNKSFVWDAFEEKHPNIKIEREVLFNQPFHDKTEQYVQKETMPDVFYMWPAGRSTPIHKKNLAKDLKPFLVKDGILGDYKEVCVDPTQQAGGYLAEIPFGLTTTNCMFVNTKVLKECGIKAPAKTYEELKEQVKILKEHGKKGIIMANQDDWVMQSCLFSMVLGRFGGSTWATDIQNGIKDYKTSEPFRKAVEFIKQMYDDGVMTQESLMTPYSQVPGQFACDQGGYLIDGDWRTGAFLTDMTTGKALIPPARQESDIELIQFPAIPGEVHPASNSGALGVGYGMSSAIPEGSAKEKAAWELIKWLSGKEVQQRRLDTGASYPSLKDEKLDLTKLEPLSKKRSVWYGTAKSLTPVFDAVMSTEISNVVNAELQYLGLGMVSVDEVINNVNNGVIPKPEPKPEEKLPTLVLNLPSRSKVTNELLEYNIRVLNISGYLVEERNVKGSEATDKINVNYATLHSNYYNGAFRLNITAKDSKNVYYNDTVYFVYVNDTSTTTETIELPNHKPIEDYYNSYVEKTNTGFKIKVPTVKNANLLYIRRINNKTHSKCEIYDGVNNKNIYEDNHLNPNDSYTYIIELDREDCVLDEKIINVTAPTNSRGEVAIINEPKAHFDSSSGKIIFDEIPSWKNVKNSIEYLIEYKFYKNPTNWVWAISSWIDINNADLASKIRTPEYYGKDIVLNTLKASITVDDVKWNYYIDVDKYNGLASIKTVNVKDNRCEIPKITNSTDGVEITLPVVKIPEGTNKIVITRERRINGENGPFNWSMSNNYITINKDLNIKSVKDIFVNNNTEYSYTIYYKEDNNTLLKSKPFLHKSNIDTLSNIVSNETSITYNESSNTTTFAPLPDPIDLPLKVTYITKGDDNSYYRLTGVVQNDGKIDWGNQTILYGKEYTLEEIYFNHKVDNIDYSFSISEGEITKFYEKLNKKIIFKESASNN